MRKEGMTILVVLGLMLTIAGPCKVVAAAENPAAFFKGKKIDFTLPVRAGGAIDIVGRIFGSHLDKLLGTTCVYTTRQQAGGVAGYNWIYRAKPDGLTMGSGSTNSFALNKINDRPGANYELDKFGYLMGVGQESMAFFVAAKGPYQTVAALQAGKNLKIASSSAAGGITLGGVSVIQLLGLDAKVVPGFKGPPGVVLATEQGETAGVALPVPTAMSFLKAGRIKPLLVLGSKRLKFWPDIPSIAEVAEVKGKGKLVLKMLDTLVGTYTILTPPGLPPDRLTFLQETANKITADPEFRAKMDKISGRKVEYYGTGQDMLKFVTDLNRDLKVYKSLIKELFKDYRI